VPTLTSTADLEAAFDHLRAAPADVGTLDMIVRRPEPGAREIVADGVLDVADGLLGDNWLSRATARAIADGRHLEAMITVMSARMVGLLGDTLGVRALAGDQLYADLDLSHDNLPAGARIAIGDEAVLEVSAKPHTGCKKFLARFGEDAIAFVNSEAGRRMRLRGLNARVVHGGAIRLGDAVRRLD
jgi:MOSC domain-containing protein